MTDRRDPEMDLLVEDADGAAAAFADAGGSIVEPRSTSRSAAARWSRTRSATVSCCST